MSQVREGMRVVDYSGATVGVIAELKLGDADAITTAGQDAGDVGGSTLPDQLAGRLLRTGYIRIRRRGLLRRDAYAASDEIAGVDGDVVTLAVAGDWLPTRR